MPRFSKFLFFYVLAAVFLCCKGKQSPYSGYEESDTGLYYKFYKEKSSDKKPKYGDFVTLRMVRRINNDSVIFDSRKSNPGEGTVEYRLDKPRYPSALESGIIMMSEGDSASFYVFTDSVQKYDPPQDGNELKKGLIIVFDVKLMRIRSQKEAEEEMAKKEAEFMAGEQKKIKMMKEQEPRLISDYIKQNKITVKPEQNGLYYVETKKGSGPKARIGNKVSVKYTGKFLSGDVFDASDFHGGKPFEFTIGEHGVIPGWEEGLQHMQKGTKATLLLPSRLAYDTLGMVDPRTRWYAIYPYTPLVFDVEIVDIK